MFSTKRELDTVSSTETHTKKLRQNQKTAAFIDCAVDITSAYPNSNHDKIISICILIKCDKGDITYLLTTDNDYKCNNLWIQYFNNEKDLLLFFPQIIRALEPDVISGFNTFGFDWRYIKDRSMCLNIYDSIRYLSNDGMKSNFITKSYYSPSHGYSSEYYFDINNVKQVDIFTLAKKKYKFISYSLKYISKELLNIDTSYGNDQTLNSIRTCELCSKLYDKMI